MSIPRNTGIHIVFSFSKVENCDLYDIVFDTFLEIIGIDLSQFQIENNESQFFLQSLSNHLLLQVAVLRHLPANV